MRRGIIKVMINRGVPRIQEELGDSIKVYSLPEWNKELERRGAEAEKAKAKKEKVKPTKPTKPTKPVKEVLPTDDSKPLKVGVVKKAPVKKGKAVTKKVKATKKSK